MARAIDVDAYPPLRPPPENTYGVTEFTTGRNSARLRKKRPLNSGAGAAESLGLRGARDSELRRNRGAHGIYAATGRSDAAASIFGPRDRLGRNTSTFLTGFPHPAAPVMPHVILIATSTLIILAMAGATLRVFLHFSANLFRTLTIAPEMGCAKKVFASRIYGQSISIRN